MKQVEIYVLETSNLQITEHLEFHRSDHACRLIWAHTYGSPSGSLTTTVASTGILQAGAYIDLCGNYTTSGSNAYTFECPVDGVYAVNAHISMGGGAYARHIWVLSYTMGWW